MNLMENFESLKDRTVLYVEDDDLTREHIARLIAKKVKTIYVATNGIDGLTLYKTYSPDIVITDIEMSVMNGLEMIDEILKIKNDQPIIITTAFNDESHKSGRVSENIVKPVIKENLFSAMVNSLTKKA